MPSGEYRVRIVLQKKIVTRDEEGHLVQEWGDWKKVWAAVGMRHGENGIEFQIRYFPGVPKELRVIYFNEILEVSQVLDLNGRHQQFILFCQEVGK